MAIGQTYSSSEVLSGDLCTRYETTSRQNPSWYRAWRNAPAFRDGKHGVFLLRCGRRREHSAGNC